MGLGVAGRHHEEEREYRGGEDGRIGSLQES